MEARCELVSEAASLFVGDFVASRVSRPDASEGDEVVSAEVEFLSLALLLSFSLPVFWKKTRRGFGMVKGRGGLRRT